MDYRCSRHRRYAWYFCNQKYQCRRRLFFRNGGEDAVSRGGERSGGAVHFRSVRPAGVRRREAFRSREQWLGYVHSRFRNAHSSQFHDTICGCRRQWRRSRRCVYRCSNANGAVTYRRPPERNGEREFCAIRARSGDADNQRGMGQGNVNFAGSTATGSQSVTAIPTSVALVSSKNPSSAGDSVTFTATVLPLNSASFVPGGTVTFTDGVNVLGTPTLGAGGIATVTTSALTVGAHTISAVYSGDNIFATSSAPTVSQQVNAIVPVITWANPAAITYGTALSATQLNATAANGGVTVPGTFVYSPAAGAILNAGPQTLTVTFTPTDSANYTTATKTVSLTVNRATPVLAWTPAVSSITYGTALAAQELNATATGAGGTAIAGSFVYTPASGTVLAAGAQTLSVTFTPTDANYVAASTTASITVGKATPAISWTTPASIAYGTALSATQLNATAAGVTGTTLPGTFVYSPAAGAVLAPGTQKLSVTFTPTDAVDYAVATASVNLTVTDLTLTSFTPTTAQQGAPDTTITITGSGFVATTVARVNGANIATTLVNATTLTAVVPAADFVSAATLQISLSNPATGSVSVSLPLTVIPSAASGTFTGPASTPPGSQPVLGFTIQPYPFDVTATFTLTAKSALASGVTDRM